MDFSLTTLFVVPNATLAPLNTKREALTAGQFGIFTSRYKAVTTNAEATSANTPYIQFCQGRIENVPGLTGKYSDKISKNSKIEWYKTTGSSTSKNQITYVGFDEVNDCKTLSGDCDSQYSITIRAFSTYINTAFSGNGLTRSVTIKTPCCDECGDNCTSVDAKWLADAFANAINAEPFLSKYVKAVSVYGGCAVDFVDNKVDYITYTKASNPDITQLASEAAPGSGYVATTYFFRVTKKFCITIPEDADIVDFYDELGYTVTEEATGDDCNVTYTITIESNEDIEDNCEEIIVPTFATLQPYKGIEWAICPCATATASGCVAGVKIIGKALDSYGNPCDPVAFPFEYDKLRFDVFAYKAPATSQDFNTFDRCENWDVTTVQKSTYPKGSGKEIKALEIRYHSYQTTLKHIFHNATWNGGFVRYSDDATFYDTYCIKFKSPDLTTWKDEGVQDETVIIAVPTGTGTVLETFLNAYFGAATYNAGVL